MSRAQATVKHRSLLPLPCFYSRFSFQTWCSEDSLNLDIAYVHMHGDSEGRQCSAKTTVKGCV
jgi:hypothetical protein